MPAIDGKAVLEHTKVLASDEFEGRAPGTKGEELTVAYLIEQLRKIGLQPGNPDGTYVQKVPLVGHDRPGQPRPHLPQGRRRSARLTWRDDYVAWTKRVAERVALDDSELVFVGYGVQAPEFQWDDYKGVDLRGKTMVVLVGDPPVPDPREPGELDPKMFGGKAMTYYGRWTYKYEMGAKSGAAGVLIVHETEPAGYPFAVVQGKTAEQFDLRDARREHGPRRGRGLDHARAGEGALRDGRPGLRRAEGEGRHARVPAGAARRRRPRSSLENTIRTVDSANVVGEARGQRPRS